MPGSWGLYRMMHGDGSSATGMWETSSSSHRHLGARCGRRGMLTSLHVYMFACVHYCVCV